MVGTSKCYEANAKQLRIILAKENTQIEENTTKRNYLTGAITQKLFTKYIIQVAFQITCKNQLHDTIGIKCKTLQNSKIKCWEQWILQQILQCWHANRVLLPKLVSWACQLVLQYKTERIDQAGGSGRRQVGHSIFISIHLCRQPEWKK